MLVQLPDEPEYPGVAVVFAGPWHERLHSGRLPAAVGGTELQEFLRMAADEGCVGSFDNIDQGLAIWHVALVR
ncbi:hypothetical protein D9M69_493290 [compost metagenome]